MSRKSNKRQETPVAQAQQADPNEVVRRITISLKRNGNLDVEGNIADKVHAYGMLEAAKDIIADWHRIQAAKAPATEK